MASGTWESIEDVLNQAAEDMGVGQMIHGPQFDLFDTMSAIEV